MLIELTRTIQNDSKLKDKIYFCSSCKSVSSDQLEWIPLNKYQQNKHAETEIVWNNCPSCCSKQHGKIIRTSGIRGNRIQNRTIIHLS